jgi:hypothetical protein
MSGTAGTAARGIRQLLLGQFLERRVRTLHQHGEAPVPVPLHETNKLPYRRIGRRVVRFRLQRLEMDLEGVRHALEVRQLLAALLRRRLESPVVCRPRESFRPEGGVGSAEIRRRQVRQNEVSYIALYLKDVLVWVSTFPAQRVLLVNWSNWRKA